MITNSMHGLSETRIDETTLAINFPDMLDSESTKIFASLSEDGRGGDIIQAKDFKVGEQIYTAIIKDGCCKLTSDNDKNGFYIFDLFDCDLKVTGIQK